MSKNIENNPAGVVIHLDEADSAKHASVLHNISNLLNELGDGSSVELVVHGPGLAAVISDAPHAEQMRKLLGRGITVAACANTMREKGVSADQLLDGVYVVPAGIAQLVRRQREGWAYVRP
ncbi:MAG TPA: DsrE family protein [Candidatus Nanopelagicaceae bacterium]|nr:DsrE family protein [Candidatus Nanopelagicaceae bacterium]